MESKTLVDLEKEINKRLSESFGDEIATHYYKGQQDLFDEVKWIIAKELTEFNKNNRRSKRRF